MKISEDALKALFPDWNGPAMDEGRSMTRTGSELCAEIEALSSSLPSGQWVAADVMEKVKAALSEATTGKPVSVPSTKPYGCSVKY